MILIPVILTAGIFVGFIFRSKPFFVTLSRRLSGYCVLALLLTLGISVGSNRTILYYFPSLGLISLATSLLCICASVLLVYFFEKLIGNHDN